LQLIVIAEERSQGTRPRVSEARCALSLDGI
jgi:hypothetical protein